MPRVLHPFPIPPDTSLPQVAGEGHLYREADYHGAASQIALPASHPLRKAKGDLDMEVIPGFEPRPLSHPGTPFNLRGGK